MKILWMTNILSPVICKELGLTPPISGGWVYSLLTSILNTKPEYSFAITTIYKGNEFKRLEIDSVVYYLIPYSKKETRSYSKKVESYCEQIVKDFKPDLIHLHGTEYGRGLALIKVAPHIKKVASIQGLVSVVERYYYGGLSYWDILRNINPIILLRRTILFESRRIFLGRAKIELEIISKLEHVIGRTSWDKDHVVAINSRANYHHCNEVLRPSFYRKKWEYEKCEKHSIMVSSSASPLKGFHQLVKAMPLILREFPNTIVHVAFGRNLMERKTLIDKLKIGNYEIYVKRLIKKLKLEDKFIFHSSLDEDEMCERYLRSNVFVCSSSIENSSNSLGEAQLLGVPSIASYVGGNPDMMQGSEENLYRFEEIEQLASKICEIFRKGNNNSTDEMRDIAHKRHNPRENTQRILKIYKSILEGN